MKSWYQTKVRYVKINEDGRERKVTEVYLVDAVSFTDAEARITKQAKQFVRGEFVVKDIKEAKIAEVFSTDEEWWYKAKLSLVTIDEEAGKEKKVTMYYLVQGDNINSALRNLYEKLSDIIVPYEVTNIALSPVCDVFPYDPNDALIPEKLSKDE